MSDSEIQVENVKVLLKTEGVGTFNVNLASDGGSSETPLEQLAADLPSLPSHLHPFRDPRHDLLRRQLEQRRILVLTSYQESAAYSAAHSLVLDDHFRGRARRAFFPNGRDKERSDLHLVALTKEEFLGKTPQILLIEIASRCTLFDSILTLASGDVATAHDQLADHSSYLILAVDELLMRDEEVTDRVRNFLPYHAVSHLRYLLTRDLADRAEELERRLLAGIRTGGGPLDPRELHQQVSARLSEGVDAFEKFLVELEQASALPPQVRRERLQPTRPQEVFRDDSELHKCAALIAAYLPNLSQGDFSRLVLLLLGDETTTVERTRQILSDEGRVTTLREPFEQRWSDRWARDADLVFRDCYLRPVSAADGSWVVDFTEPYLRRELRSHIERNFPWYLRRQCQKLKESGIFFAPQLSQAAVEGLVRLFVERAMVDPASFGSLWLLDLVSSMQIQLPGAPPGVSTEEGLIWLLEKITAEAHLRWYFHGRLALLIRELLERETLRPVVGEFFEFLIASKQHDALLGVVLDLARRLRFAPHFDSLVWLRRLLDQGSEPVRKRAADRLLLLARESGPRVFEFLGALRAWLPEAGRPPERFSLSNRLALEFPFAYCFAVARLLPAEHLGVWPSRHPLFNALPQGPESEATRREEVGRLLQWLLDPRGAALEQADKEETMRTAEAVRIWHFADVVEHWAWVLEGGSESGPVEGRHLFLLVLEEIARRVAPSERTWILRCWQRRRDDYLRAAAARRPAGGPDRISLVARQTKLDRLRERFALLAAPPQAAAESSTPSTGATP